MSLFLIFTACPNARAALHELSEIVGSQSQVVPHLCLGASFSPESVWGHAWEGTTLQRGYLGPAMLWGLGQKSYSLWAVGSAEVGAPPAVGTSAPSAPSSDHKQAGRRGLAWVPADASLGLRTDVSASF